MRLVRFKKANDRRTIRLNPEHVVAVAQLPMSETEGDEPVTQILTVIREHYNVIGYADVVAAKLLGET